MQTAEQNILNYLISDSLMIYLFIFKQGRTKQPDYKESSKNSV